MKEYESEQEKMLNLLNIGLGAFLLYLFCKNVGKRKISGGSGGDGNDQTDESATTTGVTGGAETEKKSGNEASSKVSKYLFNFPWDIDPKVQMFQKVGLLSIYAGLFGIIITVILYFRNECKETIAWPLGFLSFFALVGMFLALASPTPWIKTKISPPS